MSEIDLDEGAPLKGLPEGYETDPLTIALKLPVGGLASSPASQKPEVPDHSEAEAYKRALKTIELTLTTEITRLQQSIELSRPTFLKIADSHLKNLDKVALGLSQTGDKVLATVSRLNEQVAYLHKEYLKRAAKKLPSATTYRDQIQDQGDAIEKAKSDGKASLASVDKALSAILAAGNRELLVYRGLQEKAYANWQISSGAVEEKLGKLQDSGSSRYQTIQASFDDLAKNADKDYVAALTGLKKLDAVCDDALEQHKFTAEADRKVRQSQLDEIKARIQMPAIWDRLGGGWDVKQLFKAPMDQAERILKTADNTDAMRAAVKMAEEAEAIFLDFKRSEKEIDQMSWDRSEIKGVLATYKTDRPKDHAVCQGKFDALEKGWQKMKPSVAARAYADLRIEVGVDVSHVWSNFRGRCEVERKWREDYKRIADEIDTDLKELDKKIKTALGKEGAEGYQGQAKAEYRGLVAMGQSEVDENQEALMAPLTKRLTDLRVKVKSYLSVPNQSLKTKPESLKGAAADLVNDQAKGMAERKAYLKEREMLKVEHKAAIAAHMKLSSKKFSEEDQREYKDIKKLLDKAAEIANAKKDESNLQDVSTALALSKRCKERADLLAQGGPKVDRGKLGDLHKDWAAGYQSYKDDLKALVDAVKKLTDQEPRPGAEEPKKTYYNAHIEVEKATRDAIDFFKDIKFEKEAGILATDGEETKSDRKRAREEALTKVRGAMDYLVGNAATRQLMKNKFGLTSVGAQFHRSMRRIELEVLRGV